MEHRFDTLKIESGQIVSGVITKMHRYGATVDIGGIEGLLPVSEMTRCHIESPTEAVSVGETVRVRVLSVDSQTKSFLLGMRQVPDLRWVQTASLYPVGVRVSAKVVDIRVHGIFVEIGSEVLGYVRLANMGWGAGQHPRLNPADVVELGATIEAVVLSVDESRRRLNLDMRCSTKNPWQALAQCLGKRVEGTVTGVSREGVHLRLENGLNSYIRKWDLDRELHDVHVDDQIYAHVEAVSVEKKRVRLARGEHVMPKV